MDERIKSFDLSAGTQIRDFIAVEDVASAYLIIINQIEKGLIKGIHNFEVGTGIPRTLRNFVELIKKAKNSEIELKWGKYISKQEELKCTVANPQALYDLGWKPNIINDSDIRDYFSKI